MSTYKFDYDKVAGATYSDADFIRGLTGGSPHLSAESIKLIAAAAGVVVTVARVGAGSLAAGVVTGVGAGVAGASVGASLVAATGGAALVPIAAYGVWRYFQPKDYTKDLQEAFKGEANSADAYSSDSVAELVKHIIDKEGDAVDEIDVTIAEKQDVQEFGGQIGGSLKEYGLSAKIGFSYKRDKSVSRVSYRIKFRKK